MWWAGAAPAGAGRKAQARAAAIAARKSCYEMPLPPPFLPALQATQGMAVPSATCASELLAARPSESGRPL